MLNHLLPLFLGLLLFIAACANAKPALSHEGIFELQSSLKDTPTGERIALIAERFVGTPYDPDPMGEYVTKALIIADERVDCMYLTFRAVELALSTTPEEAIGIALDKRFHSRGLLADGKVINYDERFAYGEDMIDSGKWGEEITAVLGATVPLQGSRGRETIDLLAPGEVLKGLDKLKSGDIVFFIKRPERMRAGELVGHIGIIQREQGLKNQPYLIHASGKKGRGGKVQKVLLKSYIRKMPFIGVRITRFP